MPPKEPPSKTNPHPFNFQGFKGCYDEDEIKTIEKRARLERNITKHAGPSTSSLVVQKPITNNPSSS